jgi:hypothetical protein
MVVPEVMRSALRVSASNEEPAALQFAHLKSVTCQSNLV